jgi:hypothetical protein
MSLIDELRKQAKNLKTEVAVAELAETARRALIEEKQRGPMRGIERYFRELAEHLQVVNPHVRADYRVEGFPVLKSLEQGEYKLGKDPLDEKKIAFTCTCRGNVRAEARVRNPALAEQRRRDLRQHGLRFRESSAPGGVTLFALEAWIPVSLVFQAEPGQNHISLILRNLSHLGTVRHQCPLEVINDEFLEELARRVLRKDNRFDELIGSVVPEDERAQLRDTLAWEQRRRNAELKGGLSRLMFNLRDRLRR